MEYQANRKKNGFTLIEIIIVTAITAILALGSTYGAIYFLASADYNTSLHNISTALETARDYTLVHYNNTTNYGLVLAAHKIQVYAGSTYNGSNTIVTSITIPNDVTITWSGFNSNNWFYFTSPHATASNDGTITITSKRGTKTVKLSPSGSDTIQ